MIRLSVISTAQKGLSCLQNSFGTPSGLLCVKERHGDDAFAGEVLKSREKTGVHFEYWPEDRAVTSRILWLDGLEPDHNRGGDCDTFDRYIYIHGHARHHRLGSPSSLGCIVFDSQEVIELYDWLCIEDLVFIQ